MSDLKLRRQAVVDLARSWAGPAPIAAKPARKRVAIDALVAWAYREELPKAAGAAVGPSGYPQGWGKVSEWVEELSLAGLDENRYGVVPAGCDDSPHDDAIAVHEAMLRLDAEFAEVELPEGWFPLADLDLPEGLAARAIACGLDLATRLLPDGRRVMRRSPRQLLFRAAILAPPDWGIVQPIVRLEAHDNGQPKWFLRETLRLCAPGLDGSEVCETVEREVDGFDRKLRAPRVGAYTKSYLDPDPAEGVAARAEWEIWVAALEAMHGLLADGLVAHEAEACDSPARPWEVGGVKTARVLRDLSDSRRVERL